MDSLATDQTPAPAPQKPTEASMGQPLLKTPLFDLSSILLTLGDTRRTDSVVPTYTPPVDAKWLILAPIHR